MTGWNLPPGCNLSDIPGNTPADLAWEAAFERVAGRFKEKFGRDLPDDDETNFIVEAALDVGFEDGYAEGDFDACTRLHELEHPPEEAEA